MLAQLIMLRSHGIRAPVIMKPADRDEAIRSAYPDEHSALDILIDRLPPAVSNKVLWSSFTDTDYFIVFATLTGKVEVRIPKSWDITSDEAVAKICLEAP